MTDLQGDSIANRARFDFIRYANLWEDADILCSALVPAPGKRILSIMSAGDNALALAAEGAEVTAVDLNPAQLACAELKCAAIRKLSRDEVLAFFGINHSAERAETYRSLENGLSQPARSFWDGQASAISEGFIHSGKFERYFHLFRRRILPLVATRALVEALFVPRTAEERREFYDDRWNTWRWRLLFRLFFSRTIMGRAGRDPEFFRYVKGSVGSRLLSRAKHGLTTLSPSENPYLHYILKGNYGNSVPRYLQTEIFPRAKQAVEDGRICLELGGIDEVAARDSRGKYDGFNLSDIFEYVDEASASRLYASLVDGSRPGARMAYWNMLVPRECPANLSHRVRHLKDLSTELFSLDRAVFYSAFRVDEVL